MRYRVHDSGRSKVGRAVGATLLVTALLLASPALAQRTQVKPGWNLFTPEQDVELGRQVAQDAEKKLPMLNNRKVDDYLNRLGKRLAAKAPGAEYPYQFKAVNDLSLNAFALPGGFLYIHRGIIEAADNEAQLAGVMGHEIGHVALRHGTNQASKAYLAQAPLALLGGLLGSGSVGAIMAQIGAGFAVNSVLLKYSRDAERQSDIVGTQILYDNNFDPRAMAQFFEKLEAEGKSRAPEWMSSHPSPENRMGNINDEIRRLGDLRRDMATDSSEFRDIQRYVRSLPKPRGKGEETGRAPERTVTRPDRPSDRYLGYENDSLRLRHPENWKAYGRERALTLAPEGGIVDMGRGNAALAYGVMMAVFEPRHRSQMRLEVATDLLIDDLQNANPNLRVVREPVHTRVAGDPALSTLLSNDSPLGGKEYDWLVTIMRPEGLVYLVFVAPEQEYAQYTPTFEQVLASVRFKGGR